jgi:putative sporulation protein YtxC
MDCVRLGSRVAGDALRRRVLEQVDSLRAAGVNVSLKFRTTGPIYMVQCCTRPVGRDHDSSDNSDGLALRRCLAEAAAAAILDEVERAMTAEALNQRSPGIPPDEKDDVCARARRLLAEAVERPNKAELANGLYEYLLESDTLIVEGFMQFRMRDYMISISLCMREALLNHLADREHREFVRLLRMFVQSQEAKEEVVHVRRGIDGSYELLSLDGGRIQGQLVDAIVADLVDEGVDPADLLVSALISVAPARIVLHFISDQDTLDTVEAVFEGKVERCPGVGCTILGCERALSCTPVVPPVATATGAADHEHEPVHRH